MTPCLAFKGMSRRVAWIQLELSLELNRGRRREGGNGESAGKINGKEKRDFGLSAYARGGEEGMVIIRRRY